MIHLKPRASGAGGRRQIRRRSHTLAAAAAATLAPFTCSARLWPPDCPLIMRARAALALTRRPIGQDSLGQQQFLTPFGERLARRKCGCFAAKTVCLFLPSALPPSLGRKRPASAWRSNASLLPSAAAPMRATINHCPPTGCAMRGPRVRTPLSRLALIVQIGRAPPAPPGSGSGAIGASNRCSPVLSNCSWPPLTFSGRLLPFSARRGKFARNLRPGKVCAGDKLEPFACLRRADFAAGEACKWALAAPSQRAEGGGEALNGKLGRLARSRWAALWPASGSAQREEVWRRDKGAPVHTDSY